MRLKDERTAKQLDYSMALLRMNAAAGDGTGRYMALKTLADEAKAVLDSVEADITQHQDRHAMPN